MLYLNKINLCCLMLACCFFFTVISAQAFTANSLDITVNKNGDSIAIFRYTLEGIIENSIPQSVLEEELKKGLTTSTEPPELQSMDSSSATLLMKKFADTYDVPTGTEYITSTMDFKKAEIALQNSALSSVVSADFSPETITLTFPDSYRREFSNVDVLPAVSHTVTDPEKTAAQADLASPGVTAIGGTANPATTGSLNITSSPQNVKVYLDSNYIGEAPAVFPEIVAGTHRMEFTKDGFLPVSKNVTVNAGKTTSIIVVLTYVTPAAPEETSAFPGFFWPVVIIALIALTGGGYYFWSQKKKNDSREDEDAVYESE
jgi:hypothetical protein